MCRPKLTHCLALLLPLLLAADAPPDLILHNGKVVTADKDFSIRRAVSVLDNKIAAVGTDDEILKTKGANTKVVDLQGHTVVPGLIDSHTHPRAAMTEFDHPISDMESIKDVLDYIKSRAAVVPKGQWITLSQVFITRLREQRYPTRKELDAVAPEHPVMFSTGPDASLNTMALRLSGIDKDFKPTDGGSGFVEKNPATGEPTGILRNLTRFVKAKPAEKQPTENDWLDRTKQLFHAYNEVGLTTVCDRDASPDAIDRYKKMLDGGQLTVRLAISHDIKSIGPMDLIKQRIRAVAKHPLHQPNPMLRIIGIKTFLDGGMLTGSAYMLHPWGKSDIYAITDPTYRGVLFIPPERLLPMVRTAVESGLQFTAHSVGDGAVHALVDAYDEVNKTTPVAPTRSSITHCNFMDPADIARMKRIGILADVQPIWLYMDTRTLAAQFGYDRLRWFQPLKSLFDAGVIVGGGSDHMQKIGSFRSINPYNPFLGMQTAITRTARWYDRPLHPEEALTREQAIRMYTTNNAYLLFKDKEVGSLEPGKYADLIVLDTDLLTCPADRIRDTKVLRTYMDGKLVYGRE